MSDRPAVIAGNLVDAKNVNTHKVFRLVIDVPAEHAVRVIEAFGWPTMAAPVPVAVARLSKDASGEGALTLAAGDPGAPFGKVASTQEDSHVNRSASAHSLLYQRGEVEAFEKGAAEPQAGEASPAPIRKPLSIASKIALICRQPTFQTFLRQEPGILGTMWCDARNQAHDNGLDAAAAQPHALAEAAVKKFCGVARKRDIAERPHAVERWDMVLASYEHWQRRAA